MFVDNVVAMGKAFTSEVFHEIITNFGEASGLNMNKGKSALIPLHIWKP